MARIFDSDAHVEQSGVDAKHSENLLRHLYRQEIDPQFEAPRMSSTKSLLIVSILSLLLFAATTTFKVNNFIGLREAVYAKQGNLQGAMQRRLNLFGNIVKLTLSHADLEHQIFSHTANKRTEIAGKGSVTGDEPKTDAIAESIDKLELDGLSQQESWDKILKSVSADGAGASIDQSLGRLLAVVEQYPTIRSEKTYQQAMTSLVEIEDRIAENRMALHESKQMYNTAVSSWPWHILADMTGFLRMDYFEAVDKSPQAPSITSDTYKNLFENSEELYK